MFLGSLIANMYLTLQIKYGGSKLADGFYFIRHIEFCQSNNEFVIGDPKNP